MSSPFDRMFEHPDFQKAIDAFVTTSLTLDEANARGLVETFYREIATDPQLALTILSGAPTHLAQDAVLRALTGHPGFLAASIACQVIKQHRQIRQLEDRLADMQARYEPTDLGELLKEPA